MNIICCSLPSVWGSEQLRGVDGPCPVVKSRANTIAPTSLCPGSLHGPDPRSFFCEHDFFRTTSRLCFRFSFEGG